MQETGSIYIILTAGSEIIMYYVEWTRPASQLLNQPFCHNLAHDQHTPAPGYISKIIVLVSRPDLSR